MLKIANRRTEETALDIVNIVIGILLALSPWALGLTGAAAWNAWVVGAVIALIALGALVAFREWEEWVNLVLGGWAIIAPWVLGFVFSGTHAGAVHVIAGVIVAALAAVELWLTHKRPLSTA